MFLILNIFYYVLKFFSFKKKKQYTTVNTTSSKYSTPTKPEVIASSGSQIFKQNLFARERPKSMDITKYFQVRIHLSIKIKSINNYINIQSTLFSRVYVYILYYCIFDTVLLCILLFIFQVLMHSLV
jgi:hypothetical protein